MRSLHTPNNHNIYTKCIQQHLSQHLQRNVQQITLSTTYTIQTHIYTHCIHIFPTRIFELFPPSVNVPQSISTTPLSNLNLWTHIYTRLHSIMSETISITSHHGHHDHIHLTCWQERIKRMEKVVQTSQTRTWKQSSECTHRVDTQRDAIYIIHTALLFISHVTLVLCTYYMI